MSYRSTMPQLHSKVHSVEDRKVVLTVDLCIKDGMTVNGVCNFVLPVDDAAVALWVRNVVHWVETSKVVLMVCF